MCMEKRYTTAKIHMPVSHERTSIFKILQILFPLHADYLVLGVFYVREAITRFEYFCPGFVQERVPTVPLLFQIQLDELYRSLQSDFLQLKL